MKQEAFDFFQDHSRNFLEMALRRDKLEKMNLPDGYGKQTGECGDTVEIFVSVKKDTIQAVSFLVDGCINTVACCNTVALFAEGRSVAEAWDIHPETVINYLETLPPDHEHCAELSVGALYLALSNLQERLDASWKRCH
jgi:nitrogen fixation NifU-like protein